MQKNPFKEHMKILFVCLPILIICAIIQYSSFSGLMQEKIDRRYESGPEGFLTYEEAVQKSADIDKGYGELVVENHVYYDNESYYWINGGQAQWFVGYKIDFWLDNPPKLNDLLSRTMHAPLIISTIILLSIIIIVLIERDYRPNKSVLTLLRLPRPRSRYILEKLVSPTVLMFLFWGIQYLVAILQTSNYFNSVPEAVRPISQSPWTFDFYRILYPEVEPIWFPAVVCALCIMPLIIVTIVFIAKGGKKSWVYSLLPIVGAVAVILVVNRISMTWWIMPVLLIVAYFNCRMLFNKGQIVQ